MSTLMVMLFRTKFNRRGNYRLVKGIRSTIVPPRLKLLTTIAHRLHSRLQFMVLVARFSSTFLIMKGK